MAARMYTRTRISTTMPGWDDWFMLISYVSGFPLSAAFTISTAMHSIQVAVELFIDSGLRFLLSFA
jgi:hypothetical protein